MSIRPLLYLILSSALCLNAETVCVSTPATALILEAEKGKELEFLYYGVPVTKEDLQSVCSAGVSHAKAYQAYGIYPDEETPLWITHSDGNKTSRLVVTDVLTEQNANSTLTTVRTRDDVYPVEVDIKYLTYTDCDIIETWMEIRNGERKNITLTRFDSAYLPIHMGDVWVSHMAGCWANEARLVEEPLQPGVLKIRNKDGVRNAQTARAELMLSLNGRPREEHGATIGAALCYSGNYHIEVDTYTGRYHHLRLGINPDNSSYTLAPGETFVTPRVALSFSIDGKGGISRNFHKWGRKHMLRHGDKPRKILLNSWEGVYFDIDEPKMVAMMKDIAALGGELFVMDDGWFGDKYPRNDDTSGLGDWVTDKRKLPGGLKALADSARAAGVGFGIWLEPEMADISSEIYEKHTDWIIKAPERDVVAGRGGAQVVLDFSNPHVRDHVVSVIDRVLKEAPSIEYIKWDCNSGVYMHGSQSLAKDRQNHLYIDWHKGFEEVLSRIRDKYPELTIQACGGGGARVNWGVLKFFDEFWTSDNTDALQRIYIQWGTSHFYPSIAMASHISASPNHQTHRRVPIKFRADVAMSGRLGIELQPKDMTEEEAEVCRRAVSDYKRVRNTIQQGDLYRLHSPYDKGGVASLMYVSEKKDEAVLFWYRTESFVGQILPVTKFAGLDSNGTYRITELNRIDDNPVPFEGKCFSGAFLMNQGLDMPYRHDVPDDRKSEYSSRVLLIERQN